MRQTTHIQKWFARLGYYTVPCPVAEECVDFYQDTLNVFKNKPEERGDMASILGQNGGVDKSKKRRGVRKVEPLTTLKGTQAQQFRLVDSEEFVIGVYLLCCYYSYSIYDLQKKVYQT